MSEFQIYLQLGFEHITDIKGYDHMLFILSMIAPFTLKDWKPLVKLVTAFTLGHSITLAMAVLGMIDLSKDHIWWIEFLIPVTIVLTSILNQLNVSNRLSVKYFIVTLFGLIHGLGFSNYLKAILTKSSSLSLSLFSFNIGLELGQLIFLCLCLFMFYLFNLLLKVNSRDKNIFVSGGTAFAASLIIIEKLTEL
jgi:hypothetical protein